MTAGNGKNPLPAAAFFLCYFLYGNDPHPVFIHLIPDTLPEANQRTKEVLSVADQASPDFRTAAAGFSSQLLLPPS